MTSFEVALREELYKLVDRSGLRPVERSATMSQPSETRLYEQAESRAAQYAEAFEAMREALRGIEAACRWHFVPLIEDYANAKEAAHAKDAEIDAVRTALALADKVSR